MATTAIEAYNHFCDATVTFGRLVEEHRLLRRQFNNAMRIKNYETQPGEPYTPSHIYQREITQDLVYLARAFACKNDLNAAELVFTEIQ